MRPSDPDNLVAGGDGGAESAGGDGGAGMSVMQMCKEQQKVFEDMEFALANLEERLAGVVSELANGSRALEALCLHSNLDHVDWQGLENRLITMNHNAEMGQFVLESGNLRIQLSEERKIARAAPAVGGDGTTTTATSKLQELYEQEDAILSYYRQRLQQYDRSRSYLARSVRLVDSLFMLKPSKSVVMPKSVSETPLPLLNPVKASRKKKLIESQNAWLNEEMKMLENNRNDEMEQLWMETLRLKDQLDEQQKLRHDTSSGININTTLTGLDDVDTTLTGLDDEDSLVMEYFEIVERAEILLSPDEEDYIAIYFESLRLQEGSSPE